MVENLVYVILHFPNSVTKVTSVKNENRVLLKTQESNATSNFFGLIVIKILKSLFRSAQSVWIRLNGGQAEMWWA